MPTDLEQPDPNRSMPPTCRARVQEGLQCTHKLGGAKVEGAQPLDAAVRLVSVLLAAWGNCSGW